MDSTALIVLLVLALVALIVLALSYLRLRAGLEARVREELGAWRQREIEQVRQAERDMAQREARVDFDRWRAEAEQRIRQDAIARSGSVNAGRVGETLAPYLPGFTYNPRDARFLGSPVDFLVFDGLSDGCVQQVIFVEVKSGQSELSTRERRVRDAVREGRVAWQELRLPGPPA